MTRSFRAARENIIGDSWLDDLARASLSAAEAKFPEEPFAIPLLRVSLSGTHDLDVYSYYTITKALQDATAKIGHVLRNPKSETSAVYAGDRARARLIQRGQSAGILLFGFPAIDVEPLDNHLARPGETLAERAARELVSVLPRSTDDDASVDAVLAQRPTVRDAVNDIVNAVPIQADALDFRLTRGTGETIDSVLSSEQATVLKSSLSETSRDTRTITVLGRLDGVRTRRRIFYLEPESGTEIHGAIDIELLDVVLNNLDRQVVVTLREERVRTITGKRGRPYYRLVSLQSPQQLF